MVDPDFLLWWGWMRWKNWGGELDKLFGTQLTEHFIAVKFLLQVWHSSVSMQKSRFSHWSSAEFKKTGWVDGRTVCLRVTRSLTIVHRFFGKLINIISPHDSKGSPCVVEIDVFTVMVLSFGLCWLSGPAVCYGNTRKSSPQTAGQRSHNQAGIVADMPYEKEGGREKAKICFVW